MVGKYLVAVVGGACAGSEIAARLADVGMEVVVFEQNALPYGKIEDGLPRWHKKMQDKECAQVDAKLDRPEVHFVPNCRLGRDVSVEALIEDWGFQMIVLANGAWRDRPLKVEGAQYLTDQSLVYQNAFVYWFNHYEDRNYSGSRFKVPDGASVIGGGLASLDVIKILQFETIKNALAEREIACDIVEMEHHGIHAVLEHHGLTYAGLGLKPARLFYRKRICDMPLMPLPDDPSPEKLAKAEKVREKLIGNAMRNYGFEVFPLHAPVEFHHRDGSLVAISFETFDVVDDRYVPSGKVLRYESKFAVSSIGSLPEPLPGIPMDGELYSWEDRFTGQVTGMEQVYCVGNAITGRGNIKESLQNARRLGNVVTDALETGTVDYASLFREQENEARAHVERLIGFLQRMPETSEGQRLRMREKVSQHHSDLGYLGYSAWRQQVLDQRA